MSIGLKHPWAIQGKERILKLKGFKEVDPKSYPQSIYDPAITFPLTLKKNTLDNTFSLSFLAYSSNYISIFH